MSEEQAIEKLDILIDCFNKINIFFDNMEHEIRKNIGDLGG